MKDFSEEKKTIARIQDCIFPILCEIDQFCRERNIRYFLCAGTCLGAVRHQGFIPWDYDADVMFPREDYERFIHEYSSDPNRKYDIGALEITGHWKRQFGRVWDKNTVLKHRNLQDVDVGACVDLFPIDGFPESGLAKTIYLKHMRLLEFLAFNSEKTNYHPQERFVAFKKLLRILLKPVGWRYFSSRMNRLAKKYPFNVSKQAGVGIDPGYGKREIMDRSIFERSTRLPFNGVELSVPEAYNSYLTNLYGDYMKVPEDAVEHCYMQIDDWELIFNKE